MVQGAVVQPEMMHAARDDAAGRVECRYVYECRWAVCQRQWSPSDHGRWRTRVVSTNGQDHAMANEVDGCYRQVGFCCPYWAVFKVTSEGEDRYVESGIADGWLVLCTKYRRIPNTNSSATLSFKEECCNEVHPQVEQGGRHIEDQDSHVSPYNLLLREVRLEALGYDSLRPDYPIFGHQEAPPTPSARTEEGESPLATLLLSLTGASPSFHTSSLLRVWRQAKPDSGRHATVGERKGELSIGERQRERGRGHQVACQKSDIYPRFDSAAGLGQISLIPGQIPYLILNT